MNDWLRSLLSIRAKRRTPAAGPVPHTGASVVSGTFKMRVTDAMPNELWEWMVLSGWRNVPVVNDRRTYVELPEHAFHQLCQAAATDRDALHSRMLRTAKKSSA